MKITATHSTVYRYDFPVYLEPHIFWLRPLTNDAERLLVFDLQIAPTESVKQHAKSIAAHAQWNTLSFLTALSRQIFQTCRQAIRPYGPPWPSIRPLSSLEGSCRDLAVLFDVYRVIGIAARFVSGYECAAASSQDSYMHGWAQVYSLGIAVANGHVAAGFDRDLASPVAGCIQADQGRRWRLR